MNLLSLLVLIVSAATVPGRLLPGTAAVYLTVRIGSQSITSFGKQTTGTKVLQALDTAVQLVAPGVEATSTIQDQHADPRTSTGVLLDVRILMARKGSALELGGAGKQASDAARAMNGDSFLHTLRDLIKHHFLSKVLRRWRVPQRRRPRGVQRANLGQNRLRRTDPTARVHAPAVDS